MFLFCKLRIFTYFRLWLWAVSAHSELVLLHTIYIHCIKRKHSQSLPVLKIQNLSWHNLQTSQEQWWQPIRNGKTKKEIRSSRQLEGTARCQFSADEHYLSSHIFTTPIKVIEFSIKCDIVATAIDHTSPIACCFRAAPDSFLTGTRREQKSWLFRSHQQCALGKLQNKPSSYLIQFHNTHFGFTECLKSQLQYFSLFLSL